MKRCWDKDPEKRPSADEIYDIFLEWQNNENILLELSEYDKKIQGITNEHIDMKPSIETSYKSKLILYNGNSNINLLIKFINYSILY
jgi:hypothetical protein